MDAHPVESSGDILVQLKPDTTVVGIDEVQFFDPGIVAVVSALAEKGIRVILTGLDMDFRGEPFGCMPELMSRAERVDKLQAICMVCGESATGPSDWWMANRPVLMTRLSSSVHRNL